MNAMPLPDIAAQNSPHQQTLDWVGMQGIALPVRRENQPLAARCDAGVSLDAPSAPRHPHVTPVPGTGGAGTP